MSQMGVDELVSTLGYKDSPAFLEPHEFDAYPAYSHVFRNAEQYCGLRGIYSLSEQEDSIQPGASIIPVVYVCEARSEDEAREIHRLVWNQNVVPFLLISTPKSFRLYLGFDFDTKKSNVSQAAIPGVAKVASTVLDKFSAFKASSIENGQIWDAWGERISAQRRVDWTLLDNLRKLSEWLRAKKLSRTAAHSLIGRYVYLRYLRDRDILSNRKLEQWDIGEESIFGRNATLRGFHSVGERLEEWLNGSLFQISRKGKDAPKLEHIRKVASTFKGDALEPDQMHLDFQAYDFAHIPIETFSVVYQQFLHAEGSGRQTSAYYTPVHLVNFMLDELDAKNPLQESMRVFDPACGSGAFLVQSYRRLIEQKLASRSRKILPPGKLHRLLVDHIYGMDTDEDACGITELSLIVTLLDYVKPPDLEKPEFQDFHLPDLRNRNIFHCEGGFFAPSQEWIERKPKQGFDWIVGNPPWKSISSEQLKRKKLDKSDEAVIKWMLENKETFPTVDNQIAEAFAWKVTEHLSQDGIVGLLMPATSLFKKWKSFRSGFFHEMAAWCIVNFSNLRHILFGKAVAPASAFFYCVNMKDQSKKKYRSILTYAPMAVQQLTRYEAKRPEKKKAWALIVNSGEIREIRPEVAANGDFLPWKLAMWGSVRDKRLLERIDARFPSLSEFAEGNGLSISQGLELRKLKSGKQLDLKLKANEDDPESQLEKLEPIEEVIDENQLIMKSLRRSQRIFSFPDRAFQIIEPSRGYVRTRGGRNPLSICYPPHITVHAARKFAVFSNEFFVVPHPQIGIAGGTTKEDILKALALYLSSDFAVYHQFLSSTVWGIERDRPTKADLARIPIPLGELKKGDLEIWAQLHDKLASSKRSPQSRKRQISLFEQENTAPATEDIVKRMNELVYGLLGIGETERWLIHDLLNVRKKLNNGRIAKEAFAPASIKEIREYAETLRNELDQFIGDNGASAHCVEVFLTQRRSLIKISLDEKPVEKLIKIVETDKQTDEEFRDLQRRSSKPLGQWIYFNRNLRIYEGPTTYLLKPRERLCWLKSQALVDADEFIADMVAASTGEI